MKLVCSQVELNTSLQLVGRAVTSRPTHPVLANVLFTADAGTGRLSLTGFDLTLGIQTSLPASVEISGAVTVPARLLSDIVARLPDDSPITISASEGGEAVELTSLTGTYQVYSMSADDYPELPLVQSGVPIRIAAHAIIVGLRSTLFASSGDDSKQLLTGVHLSLNGRALEAAATDGHRLAVQSIPEATAEPANSEELFEITVPSRSLREVERLLSGHPSDEPVSLFSDRGQVVFLWADRVVTSRSLDGTYPPYRQLIPARFSRRILMDRKALLSALERVAVLADQHNNVVRLSSDPDNGLIRVGVDAQDVGSGAESLPAQIEGEPLEIAFNVRYLLEGLKVMTDEQVVLQCNTATTPAVLSADSEQSGYTYLVMPVQIRT